MDFTDFFEVSKLKMYGLKQFLVKHYVINYVLEQCGVRRT